MTFEYAKPDRIPLSPRQGEHNCEILAELGCDDGVIDALFDANIIGETLGS